MQELFDILTHKFTIINNHQANLTNAEKDSLLDELLIEKKKESLRILVETRLQQSLDSKRITDGEQIVYILQKTHKVMSICDPKLPYPEKEDPFLSTIDLFFNFFTRQNCSHRAQEISNIHKKKLCPKGLLITTFFNWLVEWARKQFQDYLKASIHSLYVDSRQIRHYQQNQTQQNEKQLNLSDIKYLIIKQKPPIPGSKNILLNSFKEKKQNASLELDQKRPENIRMKSQSPSQKSLKLGSMDTIQVQDNLPINKQVFYFAYVEEFQLLYKSVQSCVPDLDISFVRKMRKGGRRPQVKRRIKQVASNLIKHMSHIRQNIEQYYKYYWGSHKQEVKNIKKERMTTLQKHQRSESPSKTSHGNRSVSTENIIDERRKSIISSLAKKHRYAQQGENQNAQSNLFPNPNIFKFPAQKKQDTEFKNKSIQISFSSPRDYRESKILLLNSGHISAQLQIIQEKSQKIKARGNKHIINHKKSPLRSKEPKSDNKNQDQSVEFIYSSLPVTIDLTPASHVRLPKIRKLKA